MTTITFERDTTSPKTTRNFRVLIDGEHRATFVRGSSYYTLRGADGDEIRLKPRGGRLREWAFAKADFDKAVRTALDEGAVPTRAAIERVLLIQQAERENQERDRVIVARRATVRREVICMALARYINDDGGDAEHLLSARALLREWER